MRLFLVGLLLCVFTATADAQLPKHVKENDRSFKNEKFRERKARLGVPDHPGKPPALPKSAKPGELGRHVNPFIGTGGIYYLSGNLSPGAMLPFGMVRLSPDTVSPLRTRARNKSGYYYRDQRIAGFSHTRLAGTGATEGGHFLVIPGNAQLSPENRRLGLNTPYTHDNEIAFPGYYAVLLPEVGIVAELTATRRVGIHRYTFSEGQSPNIQILVTNALGTNKCEEGNVRVLPDAGQVEGSARIFGVFSGRYGGLKAYFVATFSKPIAAYGTWRGASYTSNQPSAAGDDVGVKLTFENSAPKPLEMKLALSYVSIKNARANLEAEAGDLDFDQALDKAKKEWEDRLSSIQIEGGTDRQQTIFYTSLCHSFVLPTSFNDTNGEYLGFDGHVHRADGFTYYTDMSLWDTFRTAHPLYTWIAPSAQRDMVISLVEMAKQGGHLPRWPSGSGYTNSMFGSPADIVIAEAYLKGIRDFDVKFAYQSMRKTALGPHPNASRSSGRAGIEDYVRYKYCPADLMKQAVSRTLEYCNADYAIARLAEALGHRQDADLFDQHAQYYRNLWNPRTQYFHPRDSRGTFVKKFRPLLLSYIDFGGTYTNDYVEGSALQWRWSVPFDAGGLISLFKSREYFVQELEQFFAKSKPEVGATPNGYYWQGNQPDLYAAYLFNSAGRPELTQKWVRWILDKKYGDQENGLDGNDDGGTLSAWYVFSSLGLYPTAGTDRYELTSPLWKRSEVKIGDHRLTIVAENFAPGHPYIQRAWLNDTPLDRAWIKHEEIAQGATLRFEMGPEPRSTFLQK